MRSILGKSGMLADVSSKGWASGVLWLFMVGVFASVYLIGRISIGTLVVGEILVLALGVVALIFGQKMSQPPEIMEQILYRIEHTERR